MFMNFKCNNLTKSPEKCQKCEPPYFREYLIADFHIRRDKRGGPSRPRGHVFGPESPNSQSHPRKSNSKNEIFLQEAEKDLIK